MRTSVTIDAHVYAAAMRRMAKLGIRTFSEYVESLIRDDYKNKPDQVGAKYDLSGLDAEAKAFLKREAEQRDRDTKSKQSKSAAVGSDLTRPLSLKEKGLRKK